MGEKRVYALIDTGSEETLISKKLYRKMNLKRVPLQVLLVTADGRRNLVLTFDTKFRIEPIDNKKNPGIKAISNFNFARCVVKNSTYKNTEIHVFEPVSVCRYLFGKNYIKR